MSMCYFCVFYYGPPRRGRMQALSSEFKIDQADFIYWMSFLPSNLIKEISPNPKKLSVQILNKVVHQHSIAE